MTYVDGYLLPIPAKNLTAYKRLARLGEKMWRDAGALDYKECVGEDLAAKFGLPFGKALKVKRGETVIFAYVVFKSRAHRDKVNAKVMKEMVKHPMPKKLPFDMKRMVYGGFKVLVG